jgi:hypothetical protein
MVVVRRSCWDGNESSPRARSNTEGPKSAAPGARLIHDLSRAKERRHRRATTTPFSARNVRPGRAPRTYSWTVNTVHSIRPIVGVVDDFDDAQRMTHPPTSPCELLNGVP